MKLILKFKNHKKHIKYLNNKSEINNYIENFMFNNQHLLLKEVTYKIISINSKEFNKNFNHLGGMIFEPKN